MARQYYKDSTTGQMKPIGVKVEDTLPVGTEVDYDGTPIPEGWVEVDDPNEYSTSEQRIGTWLGKPLYRKTLNFSVNHTASSNQTKSYTLAHNLTNIDKIFIDRGNSYSSGGQLALDNVYFNGAQQVISIFTRALINSTNITYNIYRNADYTDDLIITILYTKTTD